MFRRIVLLLAVAAAGWYVVTRMLRPRDVYIGDDDDLWFDEHQTGFADRVTDAASGPVVATRRPAQAPIDRIRSIVGDNAGAPPEAGAAPDIADVEAVADMSGESSAPDFNAGAVGSDATTASSQESGATASATEAGTVKGNINRDGEKIYHLPGDPAYDRTHAETMFVSAAEAEAAGFRRAGQRQSS
jgi:hypothetical protein